MVDRRTIGRTFDAEIEMYNVCKYKAKKEDLEKISKVTVTGIESWDIVSGDDAALIEELGDGSCIDDMHEYLVLHLDDGGEATFRNSYVDMFRLYA